jgi:hypothetical protein
MFYSPRFCLHIFASIKLICFITVYSIWRIHFNGHKLRPFYSEELSAELRNLVFDSLMTPFVLLVYWEPPITSQVGMLSFSCRLTLSHDGEHLWAA